MSDTNYTNYQSWWKEARFGMFIHWGLYAIPAGQWKGQDIPGISEWIMNRARIPVKEYEKLAEKFNPVKFNAEDWVKVAKDAGMKYLVITSKHHDGFAMYDSPCNAYNIVKATPFKKDPMKDLSEACSKAGIKFCFYYSQSQDWHDPDASGNNWDYPDEGKKDFAKYLENKAKPQIREILTQYGPIGLIWFDTPQKITKQQSLELKSLVKSIRPDCIVSGRIGNDVGDYSSMGDNQIPDAILQGGWETPATINNTWGFKENDHNWKSAETLLHLLVDLASKGINYLLNVGPTAEGIIPKESIERLKEVGRWMRVNGESIYGTNSSPFSNGFNEGRITCKPGKVYLHFFNWPGKKATLTGIPGKVKKAYLLADKNKNISFNQSSGKSDAENTLELNLPPENPDKYVSVVVLDTDS